MNATDVSSRSSTYDPAVLLDTLKVEWRLKNDAQLARFLSLKPALLSKVRTRLLPLSAGLLIRLHEASGKSVRELLSLAGERRMNFRVGTFSAKRMKARRSPYSTIPVP
jgi:hypothetical protein